jgi:integrase
VQERSDDDGQSAKRPPPRRRLVHALRHTFATCKAERGGIPYVPREWLGHARLDTTQIYVHLARQNTKKAMEATSL